MKRDLIILFAFILLSATPVWTPLVTDSTLSGIGTTDSPLSIDTTKIATRYYSGSLTGGSSYLVYSALLTQSGTDAPVATVLENTLGGTVVWTRDGAGAYFATLTGVFTNNKTVAFISDGESNRNAIAVRFDDDSVYVETSGGDEELVNTSLEIRVYP